MRAWILGLMLAMSLPAHAKKKKSEGIPLTVRVVDLGGEPIATAVVRHPEEADRHRVNAITGEWTAPVLYLPTGEELLFTPGMTVRLEVSAPGYMARIIEYSIRKRRNTIEIALDMLEDEEIIEEPSINFSRDQIREPTGSGPAN
ncbi:MAG: hypothetical protein AAFV53_08690 [Myxococcota bacterium]